MARKNEIVARLNEWNVNGMQLRILQMHDNFSQLIQPVKIVEYNLQEHDETNLIRISLFERNDAIASNCDLVDK